jgi:hypothetical protein
MHPYEVLVDQFLEEPRILHPPAHALEHPQHWQVLVLGELKHGSPIAGPRLLALREQSSSTAKPKEPLPTPHVKQLSGLWQSPGVRSADVRQQINFKKATILLREAERILARDATQAVTGSRSGEIHLSVVRAQPGS